MRGWEGEKKGRGVRVKRGEERKKGLGPATVRTNACHDVALTPMKKPVTLMFLLHEHSSLTSVISLEAAAAPSLRLIWGFLAPSSRARANVPMDLETVTQYYTPKNMRLIAVNLL